jgi:chromosome segregation ATPase
MANNGTTPKPPNPFQQAIDEFKDTKDALEQTKNELRLTVLQRDDLAKQLEEMNGKFEAYKTLYDTEVRNLRGERDFLQAYAQTLRTRMSIINEIVQVAMNDAEIYATKVVRGQDVETDDEVVQSIKDHWEREKRTQK